MGVAEVSTSKTGKHGHAKAHIVALDLFTNKKYEDLCPTSHNVEVPFVNKTEYQLLSADGDTGEVQLLTESGETKDDISLPTFVKIGEPTDEDNGGNSSGRGQWQGEHVHRPERLRPGEDHPTE